MKKKLSVLVLVLIAALAHASAEPSNVFVEALKNGDAITPLPNDEKYTPLKKALQKKTGDSGEIFIKAHRIVRFKQQARCGRIVFAITQPSKDIAWLDLGGQLNICDDGTPPWRVCTNKPSVLVPPNGKCDDKSEPQDTQEVKAAITSALERGGLSIDQARKASRAASPVEQPK